MSITYSISEQTPVVFLGFIVALEAKDYTVGQKHYARSLSDLI